MNIFKKNEQEDSHLVHSDYKMYIFALSGPSNIVSIPASSLIPIEMHTVHQEEIINEQTDFFAPVITTDGNIVFLPVGKEDTLRHLQQKISSIATSQIHSNRISEISIGSFAVVGTSFHLPDTPNIHCQIYRILTYQKPLPEFEHIYTSLKAYCESIEIRPKIQSYFFQALQKGWINNVISELTQRLNWDSIVSSAINEYHKEADKHEKVNQEKVSFIQIDEDGRISR